jgi:hypothetical protein
MSKIFNQTFADLGVAADTNFMNRPDYIQPSLSIIKCVRDGWTLSEIKTIGVKMKGNSVIKQFTGADVQSVIGAGELFDFNGTNSEIKTFLDNSVQTYIPKTKAGVEAVMNNFTNAQLRELIKITGVKGDTNSFAIFAQGAATTNTTKDVNLNTMVESVTLEIEAANDNARITSSTFVPATNFIDANTSRLGTPITL